MSDLAALYLLRTASFNPPTCVLNLAHSFVGIAVGLQLPVVAYDLPSGLLHATLGLLCRTFDSIFIHWGHPHCFAKSKTNGSCNGLFPDSGSEQMVLPALRSRPVPTNVRPTPSTMPAYDWKLSDQEVASVATFVRNQWGNLAPPVTADEVKPLREAVQTKAD